MKRLLLALPLILVSASAFAADGTKVDMPVTPPAAEAKAAPAAEAKVAPAATPVEVPPKAPTAADNLAPMPATPDAAAATPTDTNAALAAPEPAPTVTHWTFVPEDSSLTFHGSQMGTAFDGGFGSFTPDIYFDADHLDQSKVTADIDLVSVDAKDSERNKNILGPDWFDVKQFPTARFETTKITKTGDNAYLADATLTIHGTPQVVQLPFTLAISKVAHGKDSGKDKAVMTGKITLDRSKFLLGQGDWADPSVIANEVPVDIKVTAIANGFVKPAKDAPAKPEENKNGKPAGPANQ